MRWMLLTLALTAFSAAASGSTEDQWISRCGGPFQLCGYAERESGTVRIAQTF